MRIVLLLCLALPALGSGVDQHIAGGSDAAIGNYPCQLSLRVSGSHSCGASLIGADRAVTAAQCSGGALGTYSILGGATDRTDTDCATCVLRSLTFLNRHPQYNPNEVAYDVAVLGFADVTFNNNLQPIALSTESDGTFAGDTCTITGWGQTSPLTDLTIILQQASVTVMTNAACADTWGAASINDGHICTTDIDSSPCYNDFGGPLECGNILAGVISGGHSSCSPDWPFVYTRVSFFYSWIISQ